MANQFKDKVVLVTGGTGGLGQAVTLAFLEAGARVAVTYLYPAELEALKTAAGGNAARLEGESVDVTDDKATAKLVEALVARHGRLDALVNAVGGWTGGTKLWESNAGDLDKMLALNLRSGYAMARAAIGPMLKQRHGAIVNIAAKAALVPAAGAAAYSASKAAALALMEALAAEVKGSGVRVNTILPSIIDTEANRKSMPKADFASWPKPGDIARVILFLCSDDAKVIQGAAIPVYGDS